MRKGKDLAEKSLTLTEHLGELRKRIIIALSFFILASTGSLSFSSKCLNVLKYPARGVINELFFFSPQEGFLVYLRISFLCGIIISLPVILYEIWMFIAPAIGERFKRYTVFFILIGSSAFITGGLFAYYILIPPSLRFLLSFTKDNLRPVISAGRYISFVTGLILGGGAIFQMPVLSLILTKIGIVNSRILRKKYKHAVIIVFILSAIITPTADVFNMLIFACPLLALYELSIWISFFAGRRIT